MAEDRGRFPVGWIIVAPPILAFLYLVVALLTMVLFGVAVVDRPLFAPLTWFEELVFEPGWDLLGLPRDVDLFGPWLGFLIFGVLWSAPFFLLGLILAVVVNAFLPRGGGDGQEG